MKLLVVEDDPDMGGLVQRGLAAEGYDVTLVTNGVDFGALAYDGLSKVLYVCNEDAEVGTIDLATNTYASLFDSNGCVDGLAWDGADNTIWASPDASSSLYHYTAAGTLIKGYTVNFNNSGLAVGGSTLYLGGDGSESS